MFQHLLKRTNVGNIHSFTCLNRQTKNHIWIYKQALNSPGSVFSIKQAGEKTHTQNFHAKTILYWNIFVRNFAYENGFPSKSLLSIQRITVFPFSKLTNTIKLKCFIWWRKREKKVSSLDNTLKWPRKSFIGKIPFHINEKEREWRFFVGIFKYIKKQLF